MIGLSGDSLAVFGTLLGWSLTAGVAALTVSGRARIILWALAVVFFLLGVSVYFTAKRITWGAVVPIVYALTPPLVVGVVAAMLRASRTTEGAKEALETPRSAKGPRLFVNIHVSLTPNMSLVELATHVGKRTRLTGDELVHEIRDKLALAKLCAWAAETEESALNEVADWAWREAKLNLQNSSAVLKDGQKLHRIKVDKTMAEYVWASSRGPTGY